MGKHTNKKLGQYLQFKLDILIFEKTFSSVVDWTNFLMYDYIKERGDEIWFIDLLDELCDWGTRNTDRAIALGLCFIHDNDNFAIEVKDREKETIKESGFVYYKYESNGIPVKHTR